MRGWIKLAAVAAAFVICLSAFLQAQHSVAPKNSGAGKAASALSFRQPPPAEAWYAVQQRLDSIDQTLKKPDVESRLAEIEEALRDLKRPSILSTILPAIIAAVAAVCGLFVGGFVQDRLQRARLKQEEKIARDKADHEKELAEAKAKQDRELAEKQSKLQIGNAVVEWQLKQLSLSTDQCELSSVNRLGCIAR